MKIAFFDTHGFEKDGFRKSAEQFGHSLDFFDTRLTSATAKLATGYDVACCFVNDKINSDCVQIIKAGGIKLIALRSAGFNNVDLNAAKRYGITVCRVPGYSPNAVAEFAVGLLLALNRKLCRAVSRVHELNFSLDGLVGFDLKGKTIGIVGAGKIGKIFCKIMSAFGCQILIHDIQKDAELETLRDVQYSDLDTLCRKSDVISLHVPLNPDTFHLINGDRISVMKPGVLIVNTGRGALIDAKALITGLKSERIGGAALDVYEEEEEVFFHDLSDKILQDDVLARLLTFPNVLITSHQAFLTREALDNIALTTLQSIDEFSKTGRVSQEKVVS